MLATVAVVVVTHNLAYGVLVGVLLSGVFFAWKIGQIFQVTSSITDDGRERTYHVSGQVFFASAESFVNAFDFQEVTRPGHGRSHPRAFLGYFGHCGAGQGCPEIPAKWN